MLSPRKTIFALCGLTVLVVSTTARFIADLTYDQLHAVVGQTPALLVFTVDWCDHCRSLAPELQTVAKAAESAGDSFVLARVDGDRELAVAQKFEIDGFPTLLYVPKGFSLQNGDTAMEFKDYNWAEIIVDFVNNQTGSTTLSLKPRKAYLNWRKRVPYNRGTSGPQKKFRKPDMAQAMREMQQKADAELPAPFVLNEDNFHDTVFNDSSLSVLIYFYSPDDPFQEDTLTTWRGVTTAFTPETDSIKVTMMNIGSGHESNAALAKKYANVSDTPTTVMFAQCPLSERENADGAQCKKPDSCDDSDLDCASVKGLFEFIQTSIAERLDVNLDAIASPEERTADSEAAADSQDSGNAQQLSDDSPGTSESRRVDSAEGEKDEL